MIYDLQKASLWKRISAFLFDFIMLVVVSVGMALLLSLLLGYNKYSDITESKRNYYEEKYDVDFDIKKEEYDLLDQSVHDIYDRAYAEYRSDAEVIHAENVALALMVVILTMSILIACVLMEFVIPLILKNGRTLGKKIFGIGVIRTNCVRAGGKYLFIRALLGKYTIEIMAPIAIIIMVLFGTLNLVIGAAVLLAIVILEIVVMCTTGTRSTIHDLISDTAVVDITSQLVFESEEAMLEYKKKIHAEEVAKAEY